MKFLSSLLFICFTIFSFGQNMTYEEWQTQAKTNIRLLPEYGGVKKSKEQKNADKDFIELTMKSFDTKREASNNMMITGFKYLDKGDIKTAMYRFNQAYLLDSENSNIYLGYGSLFKVFQEFDLSREQYQKGIKMDENNEKLLIDYANSYLMEFYLNKENPDYLVLLDKAIPILLEAYELEPANSNSSIKLAGAYFYKGNCEKAREYLNTAKKHGSQRFKELEIEIDKECNEKPTNCSSVKTGKFIVKSDRSEETIITRTEQYQIETNAKNEFNLKFSITWINECTYQLKVIEDMNNPTNKNLPELIVTCRITKITENGYHLVSTSELSPMEVKSEVIRIDDLAE